MMCPPGDHPAYYEHTFVEPTSLYGCISAHGIMGNHDVKTLFMLNDTIGMLEQHVPELHSAHTSTAWLESACKRSLTENILCIMKH